MRVDDAGAAGDNSHASSHGPTKYPGGRVAPLLVAIDRDRKYFSALENASLLAFLVAKRERIGKG